MSKETENTELSTNKALHIGGVVSSFCGVLYAKGYKMWILTNIIRKRV